LSQCEGKQTCLAEFNASDVMDESLFNLGFDNIVVFTQMECLQAPHSVKFKYQAGLVIACLIFIICLVFL